MAVQADGVLLVAKHQSTSREAGRLARQLFLQVNARMLGMILNQVGTRDLRRYEYYHQKYYDSYYAGNQVISAEIEHRENISSAPLN